MKTLTNILESSKERQYRKCFDKVNRDVKDYFKQMLVDYACSMMGTPKGEKFLQAVAKQQRQDTLKKFDNMEDPDEVLSVCDLMTSDKDFLKHIMYA